MWEKRLFSRRTQPIQVSSEAKGTQEEGHVGEAPVQPETPSYTGVVEAKGTQEEGHVGEAPRSTGEPSLPSDRRDSDGDRNGNPSI